mmetsp:Transcript_10595/g.27169  ORF Transcript_10595/g.27169 Transcript_10595/m.27169 type:complete len:307 (-) Transcript_10595:421-1341(-)
MWSANAFHLAVAAGPSVSAFGFPAGVPEIGSEAAANYAAGDPADSEGNSEGNSEGESEYVEPEPEGAEVSTRRVHRLRRHLARQHRRWRALRARLEEDPLSAASPLLAGYGAARARLATARRAMLGAISDPAMPDRGHKRNLLVWTACKIYTTVNTCLMWAATVCFVPMVVLGAVATLAASALVHYIMSGYDFASGCEHSVAAPGPPPPGVMRPISAEHRTSAAAVSRVPHGGIRYYRPARVKNLALEAPPPPLPKSKSTENMLRLVLAEPSFMGDLLAELPGVDPTSAPVQSALAQMKQSVDACD